MGVFLGGLPQSEECSKFAFELIQISDVAFDGQTSPHWSLNAKNASALTCFQNLATAAGSLWISVVKFPSFILLASSRQCFSSVMGLHNHLASFYLWLNETALKSPRRRQRFTGSSSSCWWKDYPDWCSSSSSGVSFTNEWHSHLKTRRALYSMEIIFSHHWFGVISGKNGPKVAVAALVK